jgi:ribosome-binding factor A|tara:strand:+ start:218 stop:421 length:204 start_codon:yes stop_codon:yes gene_type:complete
MLDISETNNMEIINIMNKASGIFKRNIGKRISLKKIPELNFIFDDHENYANQLTDLIDSAIKNDSKK